MRKLLVLLGLALTIGSAAAADVKSLDAVAGTQVWLVENHSVPMVAITAALPAGSAYDPPAKAGLAALAAALLEEGAGSVDARTFHAALAASAIRLQVVPGRDYIEISMQVLSDDAPVAFRLLGRALARPRFGADAIGRQRAELLQRITQAKQDPVWIAWNGLHSLYFGPHAYGHPIEGDAQGLAAITAADVQAFAAAHWVRGGARIAIAGDVTADEAATLVKLAFADLPALTPPPPPSPAFVGAPGLHMLPAEASEADAIFALPGLKRDDPDFLAAMVANLIVGGGENSRLGHALRGERGLTYDVSTELVTYAGVGMTVGTFQAQPRAMSEALEVVRAELRKFATDGPTAREFADAKLYLRSSFDLAFTSNADIAQSLVGLMEKNMPIGYLDRHGRMVDGIGIDDVRRAARRLFGSDRITEVVAGPLPAAKASGKPYRR